MKIIRSLVAFLFSLLIVASSVSCAPRTLFALTYTPDPTQTATSPTTPTATPSPEPTATPAVSLSPEEQVALLDQQFQDFLNKEGDYTKEKMAEMAIWGSQFSYQDGNGTDLGILRIFNERSDDQDNNVAVYGILLTATKDENNNIFLTMGFDGKDGNRFVTSLVVIGGVYDYYHNLGDGNENKDRLTFSFIREEGLHMDDKGVFVLRASSSEEIYKYLESLEGKKIVASIPARKIDLSKYTGGLRGVWEKSNERLAYTINLIHRLASNGINTSMIGSSSKDIGLINSSDDINSIDFETVPPVVNIRYRDNG